jgi:type II secretory pathway pseudopilin PulG
MNKDFKKRNNSKKGFTLMETLVAIFIIMLAITGPMVFTQNALRAAFLSRDQITAFFLAQDAIEYIKNIRDGHVVDIIKSSSEDPDGWLGVDGNLVTLCMNEDESGCTVDTTLGEDQIDSCLSDSTPGCVKDDEVNIYKPLNFKNNTYFTNEPANGSSIVPSIFAREIKMKEIEPGKEVEVTVIVRWKSHEGVGNREIVVKENIYNWANALLDQSTP